MGNVAGAPSLMSSLSSVFIMFGVLFLIFYFLIIRPQNKRMKEHHKMLSKLSPGDRVITTGGVYGTISALRDYYIVLEIAENVKIKIMRNQILGLAKEEGKQNDKV